MIYNIKPKNNLATFAVVFKGSTNFERKGIYGIAHLMEHLQCKNFEHLVDSLDTDGIDWNAYTAQNEIVFYFTGLSKYLGRYKKELYEAIPKFSVTQEMLDSERRIVLQEYEECFSDQSSSFILNWYREHWNAFTPIGLREDIELITLQDCKDFHEIQYRFPSMVVNVDHDKWSSPIAENPIASMPYHQYSKQAYSVPKEIGTQSEQTEYLFASDLLPSGKENYYKFLCKMFVDGLKSPLYKIVREDNQLCYRITMDTDNFNNSRDYQVQVHLSSTESKDHVESIVRSALDKNNLTRERFEQCKTNFFISREKADENKHKDWEKYIRNSDELVTTIANSMTYDEMMDYASHMKFELYTSRD